MSTRTGLIGILLALCFLGLALWNTDLGKLWTFLATANYLYVLLAACATFAGYVLRTLRWQRLLRPTRTLRARDLFPILVIGFMANNVLPARAGELVRVYTLQRKASVSKSLGLSTIVLERLLDGLTLVLFIGLLSMRFPLPDWGAGLARMAGVVFVGLAVLIGLLLIYADVAGRLAYSLSERLPSRLSKRSMEMFDAALTGLHAVRQRRTLLYVAALSVSVWMAEAVSYFLVMSGFDLGITPGMAPLAAVFLLVVVNLAIMVPSAPGYVGTFQAAAVFALQGFGVLRESALGVAIVSHGMQYALITGLGFMFLSRSGLHLSAARTGEAVQ